MDCRIAHAILLERGQSGLPLCVFTVHAPAIFPLSPLGLRFQEAGPQQEQGSPEAQTGEGGTHKPASLSAGPACLHPGSS